MDNIKYFDSVDEILKFDETRISDTSKNIFFKSMNWHFSDPKSSISWYGADSLEALKEICKRGWPEGLKKLEEILREVNVDIPDIQGTKQKRRKRTFSCEGDDISLDRFHEGNFDMCWEGRKIVLEQGKGRYIHIFTNLATSCKISSSAYFYTGATCNVLTDILEEAGFRVKITGYLNLKRTYEDKSGAYCEVPIKEYDVPLNKERLIICTAFAGFFRFYLFAWISSFRTAVFEHYGYPQIKSKTKEKDILTISQIYTKDDSIKTINYYINKLRANVL